MSRLELRIPPPLVAFVAAGLIYLMARIAPGPFHYDLPAIPSLILVSLGVVTAGSGLFRFTRAGTTPDPTRPQNASSLVTTGIYGITRNPMYLGLLLVLTGWTVFLENPLGLVLLPLFVLYMNRFQIVPEERALALLFGEQYVAYQGRVRRWL